MSRSSYGTHWIVSAVTSTAVFRKKKNECLTELNL